MNEFKDKIYAARPGEIVPIVKPIDISDPVEFFARLSDYGRAKNSCLFESKDYLADEEGGELSFGTANPALYLAGTGIEFEIKDVKYRVSKPTNAQSLEVRKARTKKYIELLKDDTYMLREQLIELYKNKGINIKKLEDVYALYKENPTRANEILERPMQQLDIPIEIARKLLEVRGVKLRLISPNLPH